MTLYSTDRATIIVGDARDALAELETESVDLIVTDPPYGDEWRSGRRAESFDLLANDAAGDRDGIRDVLRECVRVARPNRHLYIFGPTDVLEGAAVSKPTTLIWDKRSNGAGDLTRVWAPSHEPITFAVARRRRPSLHGKDSVPARLRRGSIITAQRPVGAAVTRHPTEKPVALLAELVESSSRAGELILDPFAGVGSTGVAALLRGRRALLVELNEDYARVAADRLRALEPILDRLAAA